MELEELAKNLTLEMYESLAPTLTEEEQLELLEAIEASMPSMPPEEWCESIGLGLTKYQKKVLNEISDESNAINRVAIRAPRGAGKTYTAAVAAMWFIASNEAAKRKWALLTTAPVHAQLKDVLWPEIHGLAHKSGGISTHKDVLLEMRYKGKYGIATARTVSRNRAGTLEGIHADRVMIIIDEAKEVSSEIFDSIEGSLSQAGQGGRSAIVLAISTPGAKAGTFYKVHAGQMAGWKPIHITYEDVVSEGMMAPGWADTMRESWGEESVQYQNHVLGQFCSDDAKVFIPNRLLQQSHSRWKDLMNNHRAEIESGPLIIGLDPSAEGQDQTVAAFYNPEFKIIWKIEKEDKTSHVSELGERYAFMYPDADLIVDSNGLGEGTWSAADKVSRIGRVHSFKSTKRSAWTTKANARVKNSRAASFYNVRELLQEEVPLALPDDEQLWGDLQAPRPIWLNNDVADISPKKEIKQLTGRSPDCGDAVAMACYAPFNQRKMFAKEYSASIPSKWFD